MSCWTFINALFDATSGIGLQCTATTRCGGSNSIAILVHELQLRSCCLNQSGYCRPSKAGACSVRFWSLLRLCWVNCIRMYKPAKALVSGLHLMLLSCHSRHLRWHTRTNILKFCIFVSWVIKHVSLMLHCLHHGLCKHIMRTLIQKHTTAYYMSLQTTYCIDFILSVLTEIIAEHNIDEHKAERASPSH